MRTQKIKNMSKKKITSKKLTKSTREKYMRIVDEYFTNGFNGREAYKSFFPKARDTTATCNFSKIIKKEEIAKYLQLKKDESARIINMTHEDILQELKRWLEADITETFGLSKEDIKQLPIEVRRLMTKYKVTKFDKYNKKGEIVSSSETIELSFVDKVKTMEMINKHLGFYEKDNSQKVATIDYDKLDTNVLNSIFNARKEEN